MKILMVHPKFPETFLSFKHILKLLSKKALQPPLGLLTVAAMLPESWEKKLVDMNVAPLTPQDLQWADYVFISAMVAQKNSVQEILARCKNLPVKIVAGGPLFYYSHDLFPEVNHFVLNEAELTLPLFLADLAQGHPKPLYRSDQRADITKSPLPSRNLIELKNYVMMSIQYSRGCPFGCDFCDISELYGREPRTKSQEQILLELDQLLAQGWRGCVYFADDNFIGNKTKLKKYILPAITQWMVKNRYPFTLTAQTSMDLADDEELMTQMHSAGFDMLFIGVESPHEASLMECAKIQNKNRDLITAVQRLQRFGFDVQGGFIVGFDTDPATIFADQIRFIQNSGIVTAVVGILKAIPGTRLYHRLQQAHRLLPEICGENTDCTLNFIPKMERETLIQGYQSLMATIYSPKYYYQRIKNFLKVYQPRQKNSEPVTWISLIIFLRSLLLLGVWGRERFYYWQLLLWTLFRRPRSFPRAVYFAICGYHCRKFTENLVQK